MGEWGGHYQATLAKDINLLDLPGWKKHIKLFITMPQMKFTHLVNQAKPWPYNRAHHYQHGFDIPYKYKLKGFYNFDDHTLCIVAPHKYIEITNYNANLMHDLVMGRSVTADILISYSQVWTPELNILLFWHNDTANIMEQDDVPSNKRGVTK